MVDYNCVIKTIKITNEEGIWDNDEAVEYITKNYNIGEMKYGQVIHVWNVNPSGDEWSEYYVVYDNKLVNTQGDQYFRLHYDFTKNITDICAKYPEYCFTDELYASDLPRELESEEDIYQQMTGYINANDKFVYNKFKINFDNDHYSVYAATDDIVIINKDTNQMVKLEYVEIDELVDYTRYFLNRFSS